MPGPRRETRARSADAAAPHPDGGAARGHAAPPPEGALRHLLRGLHAGDLDSVLLTVAMAAEENRMPSADPEEAERILAFLARLAEHEAVLPPPSGRSDLGPEGPRDATGGEDDGAPDLG
jgi:hypothetical protein